MVKWGVPEKVLQNVVQMCWSWGRFTKKKLLFFWILSKLPPPPFPQFGQLVQLFLNAKNVDLNDIQNDSLSKICLK